MRQTPFNVNMAPGDSLDLNHRITVKNNTPREARLVGIRWELVFTEDTPPEIAEWFETHAESVVS